MILFISAIILSSIILGFGILNRNTDNSQTSFANKELEQFYGMFADSPAVQLRQLVLASKTLLRNFSIVSKDKDAILNLYNERVLSEACFKKTMALEEELVIEKTIIENEAESIKPGSKDSIFMEANRLFSSESFVIPKTKLFDEASFLKRQDALRLSAKSHDK